MRKERQYHYIYKTTNLLSGKYYIGMHSSDNLEDGYLGSGTYLTYSIKKYGKENFTREIIEFCKTRKELKSKEEKIITLQEVSKKECMNLRVGGNGGYTKSTKETIKRRRKEKKYHFIYKTTNNLSGRYYLGMHSTDNLEDGYLGSGTYLRRAIKKHGKENFTREILEFCKTRKELKSREEKIVNLREIAKKDCMNMKVGGSGGFYSLEAVKLGRKNADKVLFEKYGKNYNSIISKNYFNNLSDDDLIKVSNKIKKGLLRVNFKHGDTFRGKQHTEKTKKKMSESSTGKGIGYNNSQFGTCWITNEIINKKIYKGDEIPNGFRLGRFLKKNVLKQV